MKIDKIRIYTVNLQTKNGCYRLSEGREIASLNSTIVEVVTDAGIIGYGEVGRKMCITG